MATLFKSLPLMAA